MLLGLPIPEGEDGAASPDGPGNREFCAGEAGRATGDASFDTPDIAGLPGRGIPPMREELAGEPGRAIPVCKRVICEGGAGTSFFP